MTTTHFPSPPSLLSIQILRAVAALMVAIAHTRYEFEFKFGLGDAVPHMTGLAAGVDLFFVISGFVMVYGSSYAFGQPGAPQNFIIRRLIRIVPLYWIATSVLLAHVLLNYPSLAAARQSVGTIIASYLFVPWPGPAGQMTPLLEQGWTLNYEMFFYLLFAVSLFARPRIALIGLGLTLVLFVLVGPYFPLPPSLRYFANPLLCEFVFGMTIAAAYRWRPRLPTAAPHCLLAIGVAALTATILLFPEPSQRALVWGVPAALVVTGAVFAENTFHPGPIGRRIGKFLGLLGDASYALYLLHGFVHAAPRLLLGSIVEPARHPWLYMAFLISLSVTFSIVVHLIFERPLTRGLRRLVTGKSSSAAKAGLAGVGQRV